MKDAVDADGVDAAVVVRLADAGRVVDAAAFRAVLYGLCQALDGALGNDVCELLLGCGETGGSQEDV